MGQDADFDRQLREWLQPGVDVVMRVERLAQAGRPPRSGRVRFAVLSLALTAFVTALTLSLWPPASGPRVAFTLQTSGDIVVVRAEGATWVRPLSPSNTREQTDYFILERKQP